MKDFNTLYHIAGGILSALAVIKLLNRRCWFGSVFCLALFSGLAVNLLWELLADAYHWLPYHAVKPDIWDVVFGGLGSLIVCIGYLIWKYKRGEI